MIGIGDGVFACKSWIILTVSFKKSLYHAGSYGLICVDAYKLTSMVMLAGNIYFILLILVRYLRLCLSSKYFSIQDLYEITSRDYASLTLTWLL